MSTVDTRIEVVGTRLWTEGVVPLRESLITVSRLRPEVVGVWTAYFGPDSFIMVDEALEEGVALVRLLLSINTLDEPSARAAREWAARERRVEIRLAKGPPSSVLHPKLIVWRSDAAVGALVGSANFSAGGLRKNVELGVHLTSDVPGSPPVLLLHQVFDDAFAQATSPTPELWDDLVAAAPARQQRREVSVTDAPEILAHIATIGGPLQTLPQTEKGEIQVAARVAVEGGRASYAAYLVELSASEAGRRPWGNLVGTNEVNLSDDAVTFLNLGAEASQDLRVEAVGMFEAEGHTDMVRGRLSRPHRDPNRDERRFLISAELGSFLMADLGRAPREGDVLIIEVPRDGVSSRDPIRVALIGAPLARARGLVPRQRRRQNGKQAELRGAGVL